MVLEENCEYLLKIFIVQTRKEYSHRLDLFLQPNYEVIVNPYPAEFLIHLPIFWNCPLSFLVISR